jgi:hypothetical protein
LRPAGRSNKKPEPDLIRFRLFRTISLALVALIFDRQRLAGTIRREAGGSAGLKVGRYHQTKKHQGHDPLDNVSHFEAGGYRRSL